MKRQLLVAALLLPLAHGAAALSPAEGPARAPLCVDLSVFHSEVAAESDAWQRARLDALSRPQNACEELQLGLLLSHPVVSFQNDARALDALSHAALILDDDAVDKTALAMVIEHIEERQVLRNMLGKAQRQLRYRQRQINTLRGQINQLKNLETELEDKARAAILPETQPAEPQPAETEAEVPAGADSGDAATDTGATTPDREQGQP